MPTVIDTPERIEHVEIHNLTIETLERPQARQARPEFWRTLVHGISQYLSHTLRERPAPMCRARRPYETPMDRFTREYPWLSVYAMAAF